ncbi:hypothetical protein C5F49_02880 [Nitrosopumilus oxyclinae]|uniref:Yip1 domain-containing protein n=1 Tax=Nitrosopumilus oxyclinae TaxID=1959104 RepID=A0A7D5M2E4_9ARCH|nr:FG-GAP-like repeat-containing protein [Nitrosopumilus oxyclinae]QLH04375.1 hypothetical protein C5F49_02880 [Nitrosopumilus oxyclinae]
MNRDMTLLKDIVIHPISSFKEIAVSEKYSRIGIGLLIFSIVYATIREMNFESSSFYNFSGATWMVEIISIFVIFYFAKKLDGKGKLFVYLSAFGYASIPQIIGFILVPTVFIFASVAGVSNVIDSSTLSIDDFIFEPSEIYVNYFGEYLPYQLFSYFFIGWSFILGIIAIKYVHQISYFKSIISLIIGMIVVTIVVGILVVVVMSMLFLVGDDSKSSISSEITPTDPESTSVQNAITDRFALKDLGDPVSVAMGELNGDGLLDLVVANRNGMTASVLLSRGQGDFQSSKEYGISHHGSSVNIGDLNNDGYNDVIIGLNSDKGGVAILQNKGDGTFYDAQIHNTGTFSNSISLQDMNKDGMLDIVIADNDVSILINNGTGGFQDIQNYPANKMPKSIATGDFNGDGNLDIVVPNFDPEVTILLGSGDGTLHTKFSWPLSEPASNSVMKEINQKKNSFKEDGVYHYSFDSIVIRPWSVLTGDFNGDGNLDIATSNQYSDNVSLLFNNGDGTFESMSPIRVGIAPRDITSADFNGDGNLDIATANSISNDVSVLLNNGDGTFQTAKNYLVGGYPQSITTGDLNDDGNLDIATANQFSNDVSLLFGDGSGNFNLLES